MCLTYTVPTIHSNYIIHTIHTVHTIRTLTVHTIPIIPIMQTTYTIHMKHNCHTSHTYNTKHTCHTAIHTIPTLHSKHSLPIIEGSLEVKLPTIWTDEKQSREEAERRERLEERRVRRKKMQMREKVGKSQNTVFFPMICGSGRSKSRLAKAAGAEPAGERRDEKLHAIVARSTFPNQNVQNTWCSEHFWKLRCRKSARLCGAKHMSKSKCTKH